MDNPTTERLSRYLDGDLPQEEARELATRVAADPRLQKMLRTLEETRSVLRSIASREEAPPELDRVVEPLLRGAPPAIGIRPWVRWLATAAAVVLGATVIIEVNRQGISPTIPTDRSSNPTRAAAEPTERFALAPLPTSPLPPEDQPVGAGDRLIASPIPDMVFEDPPALEVLGPLENPPSAGEKDDREQDRATIQPGRVDTMRRESPAQSRPAPQTSDHDSAKTEGTAASPGSRTIQVPDAMRAGKSVDESTLDAIGRTTQAQFFLFDESRTVWRDFEPSARCKHGRYAVRVRVASGRIVEVWPVGAATSPAPQERLCAAGLVVDLEVDEVPEGEYHAEVVIEPREVGGR